MPSCHRGPVWPGSATEEAEDRHRAASSKTSIVFSEMGRTVLTRTIRRGCTPLNRRLLTCSYSARRASIGSIKAARRAG